MDLKILCDGQTIEEIDKYLEESYKLMIEKSKLALETAKAARKKGDFKKWGKFCAVSRVWKMAAREITNIGMPF